MRVDIASLKNLVKKKRRLKRKIEQKKKDIILKVKINNFDLDIQMRYRLYQEISGNALESQLYERAVYNSANLIGRS